MNLFQDRPDLVDWTAGMTDRMCDEARLAQHYVQTTNHGTSGHLAWTVIDHLVKKYERLVAVLRSSAE